MSSHKDNEFGVLVIVIYLPAFLGWLYGVTSNDVSEAVSFFSFILIVIILPTLFIKFIDWLSKK